MSVDPASAVVPVPPPAHAPPPDDGTVVAPPTLADDVAAGAVPGVAPAVARPGVEAGGGADGGLGPAPDRAALDRALVRGVAWTGALKLVSQVVGWATTLLVASLLSPTDYGIVGTAQLFVNFLIMIGEGGFGTAIVARRDVDEARARQLHTLALVLAAALALVIVATSWQVARFFKAPTLPPVLWVLAAGSLVLALRTVPAALLQRDLAFKRLAAVDALQTISVSVLTVVLAYLGFGYWTLVAAFIASWVVQTGVTLWQRPVAFARPRLAELRPILGMGGHLVVQRAAWYGYTNADTLVVGRVLGQGPLGLYSLATVLASTLMDRLSQMVLQVIPGVLSRVQHDVAELRRYTVAVTELLALVLLPVCVGIALVARDFTTAVLGPKWVPMTTALQLLSLFCAVKAVQPLFQHVLNVQGRTQAMTRANLLLLVLLPPIFLVGSRWGITGVALGWLLVAPWVSVWLARHALADLGLSLRDFFDGALRVPVTACAVMSALVLGLAWALPAGLDPRLSLAAKIAAGGAGYAGALLLLFPERIARLRRLVRPASA